MVIKLLYNVYFFGAMAAQNNHFLEKQKSEIGFLDLYILRKL